MNTIPEPSPRSRRRTPRRDGQSTRSSILEAAGRLFAERGFAEATSKEICERAGVNSAAVNYYFGGKESLYEEVLVEAHGQMLNLDDLNEIMASSASPEKKLRAFLERMINTAFSASELWGIKIFVREVSSPSPFISKALTNAVLPKADVLRSLLHEITGLPPDSNRLQRATAFVIIPCISLIMFPSRLRAKVLPATTADPQAMLDDLMTYALGGLKALGASGDSVKE